MLDIKRKDRIMLLEIVNTFGAITLTQAERLLSLRFPRADFDMTLQPLLMSRQLKKCGEYLFSRSGELNQNIVNAIDIMLLIGPEIEQPIMNGTEPFLLTFFKLRDEKLWRYDICPLGYGTEAVVSALLENINTKYRKIIFMPEKAEQMEALRVPCEHCYVLKNNEKYQFYVNERE